MLNKHVFYVDYILLLKQTFIECIIHMYDQ